MIENLIKIILGKIKTASLPFEFKSGVEPDIKI
jgi:hypothetical protein